ncbi:MAG TPA: FliA/WhiG family RNA polymerase sigma factor [Terriglobia bacterium]|jgi:RNA polymerase sigma factor for flagellar operon FliA|nr:FliA/WhiG family RNA polymerase sigma factor [Terriglobia bacterium]
MSATPESLPSVCIVDDRPAVRSRRNALLPPQRTATKGLRSVPRAGSSATAAARRAVSDAAVVKLLSLVKRVAFEMREHLPAHVEVDDLAGAGVLGLLDAVRRFDARKHVKIETYARHRIRGAILDSLRSLDTASRDMRRKNKAAERVYHELQARAGRPVRDDEMARALGISLKKWYSAVQELQTMGIDWLRPTQIPETPLSVTELPADNQKNQMDLCYRQEQRDLLARALTRLSERERTVVTLYYEEEMTMKEIGEQLGIDESRVSQLHSAAIGHLRNRVQSMLRGPRPSVDRAHLEGETRDGISRLFP